jgi:hypothetical protein
MKDVVQVLAAGEVLLQHVVIRILLIRPNKNRLGALVHYFQILLAGILTNQSKTLTVLPIPAVILTNQSKTLTVLPIPAVILTNQSKTLTMGIRIVEVEIVVIVVIVYL